jgi:hypothetical protein
MLTCKQTRRFAPLHKSVQTSMTLCTYTQRTAPGKNKVKWRTAWLDAFGHPRSESMHITERYRRRDFGHMDLEITFNDPRYYTRPFNLRIGLVLIPDSDLLEYVCVENEKDRPHLGK